MVQVSVLDSEWVQRLLLAAYDLLAAVEADPATLDSSSPEVVLAAGRMRAEVEQRQAAA